MPALKSLKRKFMPALATIAACVSLAACGLEPTGGASSSAAYVKGPEVNKSQPVVVALLVPSTANDAAVRQIAADMISAARLAVEDQKGANIDLQIFDTKGDAATSSVVAKRAQEAGAKMIIGPLFAENVLAVSNTLAQSDLKILAFSNTTTVAGANVHLLGPTPDGIADRLVSFAAGSGLKNIGVVYPNDIRGEIGRDSVLKAAQKSGARIVTAAPYTTTDVNAFNANIAQAASKLKAGGANAIVLTDAPAASLPFAVDGLAQNGVTNKMARMMGLTQWNETKILMNPNLQNGWFTLPDPGMKTQFDQRFTARFNHAPHPLSGLAYDGVAVTAKLLGGMGKYPFSSARLMDKDGFVGSMGILRFTSDGLNQRGYAIMEVSQGGANVVSPAPKKFSKGLF